MTGGGQSGSTSWGPLFELHELKPNALEGLPVR